MISTEVKMGPKLTPNFIVCEFCKLSNQFVIEVVEQKGDYYYGEKCPRERCGHFHEFRVMLPREAKKWIDVPAEDPFAQ